ncbi:excisionase family DNA binding protein [Marinobacterium halophilum]|uniref:Excisionase family DNA binding protein n=1 Tax=Marinobacterium halophilum TaxID=267374 RepID=A0A2P8F1Z8_9GAMM|nr:excisionase family DNA binding protein [Marinobacterium halophilum]
MSQVSNQDVCTSRKAAELLGVTPRTVQLWADSGILQSWKTPGGHRRFSLSAIERLANEIRNGDAQPVSQAGARKAGPARMLVIEDDVSLQRLYAMTVRNWGLPIELKQSTDGYQGLLELGQFEPDLLVLDLNLPNIDGFSVIEALVRQGALTQMQLMVVTALPFEQVQPRIERVSSGIEVLSKPIPFLRIRESIEKILLEETVFS